MIAPQSTSRAIGSLAFKDEGNQLRLHNSGACAAIVTALRTHGQDPLVAEYTCRAVYNMSTEVANVSEFGAKGVCGLIVATMQVPTHSHRLTLIDCYHTSPYLIRPLIYHRHVMSYHVVSSHHIMSCYLISYHIMSCFIMSCHTVAGRLISRWRRCCPRPVWRSSHWPSSEKPTRCTTATLANS